MYLLDRLYELPEGCGTITVGGVDIRRIDLAHLRSHIGIVLQEPFLFSKTFRESISDGAARHDEETVRHYARLAVIDDAIENFSQGYDTPIGERGVTISGGQKQRVAIAGVVAMRPDCLILDEATAMLDPRGREQVMQTIHYLNRNMGITVVSITHYMEEAAQADRVLVMSKGHVVMEGTPKEVFSQTEKVRSLHLDVPQAAELRDELVKAGIPMPEGIIDTGACAQALYELLQ